MANELSIDEFMKPKVGKGELSIDEFMNPAPEPSYMDTVINNAVTGAQAAGDFATFNYQEPSSLPAFQNLRAKSRSGEAKRQDYLAAFLEGGMNSPPGKALQAVGGLIPEFNLTGSAVQKYVNPAIVDNTGLTNEDVIVAEMALPFIAKGTQAAFRNTKSLPPRGDSYGNGGAGGGNGGSGLPITKAITSPLRTIQATTDIVGKALSPVTSKIVQGDNIITGEMGINNALKGATSLEGQRLGQKLGINFSTGELTGHKMATGLEDALANTIKYGDEFAQRNLAKNDAIVSNYKKVLNAIHPQTISKRDAGDLLASTYNNTITNLIKNRGEQAKIDFGAALSKADGEANILSNNLFSELQAIKAEGQGKLLTGTQSHAAALANFLLKRGLSEKTQSGNDMAGMLSLKDFQAGLSNFGAAAKRSSSILEDAKTAAGRRVYARLYTALQKDLDAEIANPRGNPEYTMMLKIARDNYAKNSAKINDIEGTTLGKMIGDAAFDSEGNMNLVPEKVAAKLDSMQPTEISNTMKFLDKSNSESANAVRRYVLESALRKTQEGQGLSGVGMPDNFSRANFVKNLPDESKLNALLGEGKATQDIMDIAAATNRLNQWGAAQKGSQTAQRLGLFEYSKNAFIKAVIGKSLIDDLLNPLKKKQIIAAAKKINQAPDMELRVKQAEQSFKR